MTFLLNGFHPSFDALSALVDASDVDAARTRVGRHVARCADCAREVEEIRALGERARAIELPGAPAGLWERIERAAPAGDESANADHEQLTASSGIHLQPPARGAGRPVLRGGLLLAAAAIVGVILFVPTTPSGQLEASASTGRWRFNPERPVAGSVVAVRYQPVAGMFDEPALLLLGGAPRRLDDPVANPYLGDGLEDSLSVLLRQPDGAYTGSFRFPIASRTMVVHLTNVDGRRMPRIMSTSGPISRTPEAVALVVAGDAGGRPSLAALTEATQLWPGRATVSYAVSDTLIRYFPSEPVGYATARRTASGRLIDDVIAWFKRGERQYVKFDSRYADRRDISADHEIAMVTFANRIDEPGEMRKWTMRLVRDHADDPRTLYIYSSLLGQMLSRNGTVDSVRHGLPLADSLWERNGHRASGVQLASVASTVGDRAAQRRWMLRGVLSDTRNFHGGRFTLDDAALGDPAVRAALGDLLRRRVTLSCVRPAGKYPLWRGIYSWEENCSSDRAWAFSALSAIVRADGRPQQALALADSSLALSDSVGWCGSSSGHRRRGEALLALGDTAKAIPELAAGLGYANWQSNLRRDSLGVSLRRAVPADTWNREAASAQARLLDCLANRTRRIRETQARRRDGTGK